jgi:hypothetical protein
MSQTTLDITRRHRKAQTENSPFSEEFQIVGGGTFKGIFDRSHIEDEKDRGNVTQKQTNPMIQVAERPDGLTERTSKIRREGWTSGDKEYTFFFYGIDDEGVPVVWLY